MNTKQIVLAIVLADFAALTGYAVYAHGFAGFFALATANLATLTAFADLCIALGLIAMWMWQDARDRGWSPLPYLLLTLTLGSIGPLVYLIRREGADRAGSERLTPQPLRS
jgi:hypothetical protein